MKKSRKTYLAYILVLAVVCSVFSIPAPVSAATRKCYTISSANTPTYN